MSTSNIDTSGTLQVATYQETPIGFCNPIEVFNLTFQLQGLGSGVFDPKDDITPLESVHIAHMFLLASCSVNSFVSYNYGKFIKDHKLERHFTITP